jgi:hypothetical protein
MNMTEFHLCLTHGIAKNVLLIAFHLTVLKMSLNSFTAYLI